MTVQLIMDLGARKMDSHPTTLMWAAFRQLTLVKAALRLHVEHLGRGEVTSVATFASQGLFSEVNSGSVISHSLRHGFPTTIDDASALIDDVQFHGAAAEIVTRGFVYELAVFRNMLRAVASHTTDEVACESAVSTFDGKVPDLVPLRDTLAHLDERYRGLSRGRGINPQPTSVQGETLDLGLVLESGRIGAHAADGQFRQVEISDSTVEAATELFQTVVALFPLSPPNAG